MVVSLFETPIRSANSLMDSGVNPLRRKPEMVGILGSSQPSTLPVSTSSSRRRLLMTV